MECRQCPANGSECDLVRQQCRQTLGLAARGGGDLMPLAVGRTPLKGVKFFPQINCYHGNEGTGSHALPGCFSLLVVAGIPLQGLAKHLQSSKHTWLTRG